MKENMVYVKSESDSTVVLNIPELPLQRTWVKRGSVYPFERDVLIRAYYDPSVEYLFKEGILTTEDEEFLKEVGLMDEESVKKVEPLTVQQMQRIIKLMPVSDVESSLKKLTDTQLEELGEYAVAHYSELKLDRIDILSKATRKNILKAIENKKAAEA